MGYIAKGTRVVVDFGTEDQWVGFIQGREPGWYYISETQLGDEPWSVEEDRVKVMPKIIVPTSNDDELLPGTVVHMTKPFKQWLVSDLFVVVRKSRQTYSIHPLGGSARYVRASRSLLVKVTGTVLVK